ncbi:MAG: DNA replication/repair protein RecF [Clostridia bacterium]|nr:DNA replication/repair protein RecF [Clostridia bacterium]
MYIESVKLDNFRNYSTCEVKLKPHLNVFKGNNAQGKTNFLESIYFSSIGKSPKTTREKDLILWGKDNAKININLKKQYFNQTIETYINAKTNKSIKINGLAIRKIGDLIGEMPVVYFSPEEIGLIKDGPADRRRFMDIDISQLNRNYFYLLCRYEKVLSERNKLLKQTKNFDSLYDTIDLWDTQLAEIASKIIFFRLDFIEKIKEPAKKVHSNITSNKEVLEISYQGIKIKNVEEIKQKLLSFYKSSLKKDFEFGYTTVGPHRDDVEITVNNIDVRNFGSQGQQRLATLSLKIAELVLFEKQTGEKPILLLDDVLSELDTKRCQNLLKEISEYQTILTTTKFNKKIDEQSAIFIVKNAKIEQKIEKKTE